jgi:hypothetical protein
LLLVGQPLGGKLTDCDLGLRGFEVRSPHHRHFNSRVVLLRFALGAESTSLTLLVFGVSSPYAVAAALDRLVGVYASHGLNLILATDSPACHVRH